MAKLTIALGALLIILGIAGFVATGSEHPTALIPAGAGVLFVILAIFALNPNARKHAMHAAAALALLGFLGTIDGVIKTIQLASGATVARAPAAISKAIMSILCLIFVGLCVRSFINARRGGITSNV